MTVFLTFFIPSSYRSFQLSFDVQLTLFYLFLLFFPSFFLSFYRLLFSLHFTFFFVFCSYPLLSFSFPFLPSLFLSLCPSFLPSFSPLTLPSFHLYVYPFLFSLSIPFHIPLIPLLSSTYYVFHLFRWSDKSLYVALLLFVLLFTQENVCFFPSIKHLNNKLIWLD